MKLNRLGIGMASLTFVTFVTGCDRLDMYDQPRYKPLAASQFFSDGLSARQPVEGSIPRGGLREDGAFFTGKSEGRPIAKIPEAAYRTIFERQPQRFKQSFEETEQAELRQALLERGQQRFNIYCSVCHGRTGDGRGMVVQRGFRAPPNYTIDRLRNVPVGHFFDVISNGIGAMASYANRVDVGDRWAIAAYIRALQLSQHASLDDVPTEERTSLEKLPQVDTVPANVNEKAP
jgi:mono/diheme cytochrome c family protein